MSTAYLAPVQWARPSGATVSVFAAGTETPALTFQEAGMQTPHPHPIPVNSPDAVWLPGGVVYRMVLKDGDGAVLIDADGITGVNDPHALRLAGRG